MKTIATVLTAACMALAASGTFAQDVMKKEGAMTGDTMMKKEGAVTGDTMVKKDMTMQQCKDHMAMSNKDGMKKDDAMMKMDKMCADMSMMKKDDSMKQNMPSEPTKK